MRDIPDDPIIRSMERTGYPPWYGRIRDDGYYEEDGNDEFFEDEYYGNETNDY